MNIRAFYMECSYAYEQKRPMVCFKHPSFNNLKAYIQNDNHLYENTDESSGFVFAPFLASDKTIIFPATQSKIISSNLIKSPQTSDTIVLHPDNKTAKEQHLRLVQNAITTIKDTALQKVVVSRKIEVKLSGFDFIKVFHSICNLYPTAFTYCWYHPKIGLWLGATPERLLTVSDYHFKTMALAATQAAVENKKVEWKTKEKNEQQLVTNYILEQLTDLENVTVSKPSNKKAGNLWHICTEISGKLPEQFPVSRLIKRLHPTPAVCGLPKTPALAFIKKYENYDRKYYTGYLGELNMEGKTDIYVNLRCMEITKKQAIIYAGGGITADSYPQSEWEETQRKSETMLIVL
ncbi:MAG: isochorismate synthase [Flavobacteriales bacterium]|nr:MAG: isochorismate synthase [Flavobacteriales bacterium]